MPAVERWKVSLAAAGQDLMKKLMLQPAKRKGITLSFEGAPDVPRNRYVYYKVGAPQSGLESRLNPLSRLGVSTASDNFEALVFRRAVQKPFNLA